VRLNIMIEGGRRAKLLTLCHWDGGKRREREKQGEKDKIWPPKGMLSFLQLDLSPTVLPPPDSPFSH
jgi:hypothetical protein